VDIQKTAQARVQVPSRAEWATSIGLKSGPPLCGASCTCTLSCFASDSFSLDNTGADKTFVLVDIGKTGAGPQPAAQAAEAAGRINNGLAHYPYLPDGSFYFSPGSYPTFGNAALKKEGSVKSALDAAVSSGKPLIVPVWDTLGSGSTKPAHVVGWGTFIVTFACWKDTGCKNGKPEIQGHFTSLIIKQDAGQAPNTSVPYYGLKTVSLSQ
jgi:hypothetical protein